MQGSRIFSLLASVLLGPAALDGSEASERLWYPTGEPELVEIPPPEQLLYRLLSWEAYKELTRDLRGSGNHVILAELPEESRPLQGCGLNFSFAGMNRGFCVFGTKQTGLGIYADTDGDSSLRDEKWVALKRIGKIHAAEYRTSVTESIDGQKTEYPVMIRVLVLPTDNVPAKAYRYTVESSTIRRGVIRLEDRPVPFELRGISGIYDHPSNALWFDLDGDGQGGTSRGNRESDEYFYVRDEHVNLFDSTYRFEVDRYGRYLVLAPLDEQLPGRPALSPGTDAPGFQAIDIEGVQQRLSRYEGSVVLLDFWSVGCGPCIEEAPKLARLHERYFGDGLRIVGVSPDKESKVRTFIEKYGHDWSQLLEAFDGPIHATFRVFAYPTKFLIGRKGTILCSGTGDFWERCEGRLEAALGG